MSVRALWISDHTLVPVMRHTHDFYQLIYCQRGNGAIEIGDTLHKAEVGRAYLIKPMAAHAIHPDDGMRAIELKFEITAEEYDKNLRCLPTVLDVDGSAVLSHSLREIVREGLSGAFYSHEATSAAISLFLVRLLREHRVVAENRGLQSCLFDTPQGRGSRDAAFLRLLDYIEHHLSEEITIDDLCELAGLERSYLITRFKRTFGTSPIRYLNAIRIEQAKRLLATTEKSITEIAYGVGFGSLHYFCRFFKSSTGMPPNAYREANRTKA